ncbi:MAG TPA: TonB C-terminal domain-containing protein [Longimicrobiales bacterium]|nr:TonB C-terminal domain-containing protein [Longimicrobiales bacterium]
MTTSGGGSTYRTTFRRAPRRRERPGALPIGLSIVIHAVLLIGFFASGLLARPAPVDFRVYEVDLVAGLEPEPPLVQTPPEAVEEPPAEEEPEPEQTVPSPAPQREAPRPEQPATPTPSRETPPERAAGSGDLTVQIEGLQARYPEYYENIIRTLYRFFRWNEASRPSAEYFFYINRDGSVSEIRLIRTSGNVAFNLEAMGAIEAAGDRRAFGRLPDDFEGDRLPVLFSFQPQ